MNAVGIVLVLVPIVDGRAVRWHFFRAVIDVTYIVELELMPRRVLIGVGEVVACVERAVELHVSLREELLLARDAVHVVVAHCKGVRSRLIVRSL